MRTIVVSICLAAFAGAQERTVNPQKFTPAIDSKGYFSQNGSQPLRHLSPSFGLITHYAYKPMILEGPSGQEFVMRHLITAQLQAGVGLFGIAEVGLGIPLTIWNAKVDPKTDDRDSAVRAEQGVGDIVLFAKGRVLPMAAYRPGIAVVMSLHTPTGDDSKFLGEGQVIVAPSLVVDKDFFEGDLRVAVNVGARIRGDNRNFIDRQVPSASPGCPNPNPNVFCGTGQQVETPSTELTFGVASAYGILDRRLDFVLEMYGSSGTQGNSSLSNNPMEILGGIKVYLAENSYFGIAAGPGLTESFGAPDLRALASFIFEAPIRDRDGDGIKDDVDRCPDEKEDLDDFEDSDGCPDPDNDRDGIPDAVDRCPDNPEDFDGYQDTDGCPERDNDHDGIPDRADRCPQEREVYNGFEDSDGCPDEGRVIARQDRLQILDNIYFQTAKAIIKPVSYPILDAVAATMEGNPNIILIEVQGHADERGADDYNLQLTQARSESVRRYLIEKGVAESRLRARGYGETKPVCQESNEQCWSQNRRVVFAIIKAVEQSQDRE